MYSFERREWQGDRMSLVRVALLLGWVLFVSVDMCGQPNQPPSGSSATSERTAFLPRRNPILIQYPPPEINIPYTEEYLLAQLRQRPNDFVALFYLMCLYAQQGKWEQSLRYAIRARQLDVTDINVHMGIVYAFANLGRWQEAETAVQTALKQSWDAGNRSALLRLRGDLYMDRYRSTDKSTWLKKALADYQQALKADPKNIQAQVGVARVMISRKQYAEAKRRLQKALSQVDIDAPSGRRKKALVLYYLGVIEEMQGKPHQAEKFYQEAVKTHPQSFLPLTEGALIELIIIGLKAIKESQAK
jgi:tetratricopeptide (TPR) repeat protein